MTIAAAQVGSPDVANARRKLQLLHGELRSQGHNPLDALRIVAERLSHDGVSIVDGDVQQELGLSIDSATAASVAFQSFLTEDLRGPFGQYLTPTPVAEHLAELLSASSRARTVMDPFLGSAILIDAFARRFGPDRRYVGWEINPVVAEVAQVAATLSDHDVDIRIGDAFNAWINDRIGSVDAIVANPPFGSQVRLADYPGIIERLGQSPLRSRARVPVELLAMELSMDRLVDGGQLGIVLPYGVLTNSRYDDFRESFFSRYTLKHCTLLPDATFAPFRGVATSCVLLIANERGGPLPYAFTHAQSSSVGYDETGRSTHDSDLVDVEASLPELDPRVWLTATGSLSHSSPYDELEADGSFRLGDIAEIFRGKNPSRDAYVEGGPFLLKVGSLSGSFISWRDRSRSRLPLGWFEKNPSKHLRAGDICFTASAHKSRYIGLKMDLINRLPELGAMPSGEVVVIRLKADPPFSAEALLHYLRSAEGYTQIQRLVRGSTAHVYPSDLVGMNIPDLRLRFDVSTVTTLHRRAEETFYQYLELEAQASSATRLAAPEDVLGDEK